MQQDLVNRILKGDGLDETRIAALESALSGSVRNLLSVGKDAKTVKGEKYGVQTAILYMAPADVSGLIDVCPSRTKGCGAACLFTAGQGRFNNVKMGRIRRTYQFALRRQEFMTRLLHELDHYEAKANESNFFFAVRLNGTSDVAWEDIPVFEPDGDDTGGVWHPSLFEARSQIQFYDYTKRFRRIGKILKIPNYHVTFSQAETKKSREETRLALELGVNATVVFRKNIPSMYHGFPVVDGDSSDIRFWDGISIYGGPVIIALKAKGAAKYDKTGFVVDVD